MSSEQSVATPADFNDTLPEFQTSQEALDMLEQKCQHMADETAFYDWMDLQIDWIEPGRAILRLPFDESVTTPSPPAPPTVHGGLIATLVDLSGIVALFAATGDVVKIASADLNVDFHSTASEPVVADAVVVDIGSTLATARVSVYPAEKTDPEPIATGRTTIRLFGGGET